MDVYFNFSSNKKVQYFIDVPVSTTTFVFMRILILIFTLVFASSAFGQKVKLIGRCIDKTGVPIDGVSVTCKNAIKPGVYTDSKGYYELEGNVGEHLIILLESISFKDTLEHIVTSNPINNLPTVQFNYSQIDGVRVIADVDNPFEISKIKRSEEHTSELQSQR